MDKIIREAQKKALRVFSKCPVDFALSGGTALELYYLHHRFSVDLDFFSPKYNIKEIDNLIKELSKSFKVKIKLDNELVEKNKARIRFYTIPLEGSERPLKIDFIEDVVFDSPDIKNFDNVRVYTAENIYLQKIIAITGTRPSIDHIGREIIQGRVEARDVFDIYMLSKQIKPLNVFLQKAPRHIQRGIVQWYRRFSRIELKLALLELDIYLNDFNSKEMIIYLEKEVEKFIQDTMQ